MDGDVKMKITKRQLRRIIKEEKARLLSEQPGIDWKAATRAVTGDSGDRGAEENIEFDLERISDLALKLMDGYTDGADVEMMSQLHIYINDVARKLADGTWADF